MSDYNPEWVVAVLEDLRNFCEHCNLKKSTFALEHALEVVLAETQGPIADTDSIIVGSFLQRAKM